MTSAQDVIARIGSERDRFLGTVDELGPRATTPFAAGEWSAKDVLAHFISWADLTVGVLDPTHARGTTDFPGGEELNRRAAEALAPLSLSEVREEFRRSSDALEEAVLKLPPGDLDVSGRLPWAPDLTIGQFVKDNSYGHWPEHEEEIRSWAGLAPR